MSRHGSLTCQECGRTKDVPFGLMDELGGVFTCTLCERDLPTPADMREEEVNEIRS